jgi:hypothetical protein
VNVHSNLLGSIVRGKHHSSLACLLLFTIGYGAIVEAAHSHGFPSARASQLTAVCDYGSSESSYQDRSNHSDCSLCQFQRQLFGGFVHVILSGQAPQQIAFRSEEKVPYLPTSTLPPSGRAPPLI